MSYYLTEDDKRIYFEYHQGERAVTVLLSHGWGMGSKVWENTQSLLQDNGYSVVAYDHRGCGKSDKDFTDVSIGSLGDDIVGICKQLGLEQVVLNGWSLGGAVAVDAASKLGTSLAGLVLTCGATPRYTQAKDFSHGGTPDDVIATLQAVKNDRANFLKTLYFEGVFVKDVGDELRQWAWEIAMEASPSADGSLLELAHLDQRSLMANLAVSSLVVLGDKDGVADPDIGRFAADCLQKSKLVEITDCGHAPFIEYPDLYHSALLSYLEPLN